MGDPAKQLRTPVWEVYKKIQLLKHACFSHSSCGTNCKHFVHWPGKRVAFYTIPRQGCLQNIGFLYSKVRATCLQVAPSAIKNGTPGQTCCDRHNFYSSLTKWLDCWEKKKGLNLMCQGLGTSCLDMTCRVISHDACHVMSCHVACHVMSSVILCGKNPTPSFREIVTRSRRGKKTSWMYWFLYATRRTPVNASAPWLRKNSNSEQACQKTC